MKYGLLVNRSCRNIGDDIQSYAESQFLPRIDYMVDREYISDFKPKKDDEVVATIMGAWWTRHKWNFPPAKNIYPLWTSIHLTVLPPEKTGTPIADEIFTGVGADHLKAYGPVGTRDMDTLEILNNRGIPAFFSGCTTLTLPKQKKKKLDKEYILLVDLDPRVEKKIRKDLEGSNVDIKKISNTLDKKRTEKQMDDWKFRESQVVEYLELYQNAKCVITRRLHVALPCLAMEVPVFVVFFPNNDRFSPYNKWLHMVTPNDFLEGNYDYDFLNPKPNKKDYLKYRKSLTKQMTNFISNAGKENPSLDVAIKTTYTDQQVHEWQHEMMKLALDRWVLSSKAMSERFMKIRQNQASIYNKPFSNKAYPTEAKKLDALVKQNTQLVKEHKDLLKQRKDNQKQLYFKARRKTGKVLRKLGLKK